jgi:hypothetical protein
MIVFQFHPLILGCLRIGLQIIFDMFSMGLSWSHDLGRRFDILIQVDPICRHLNIEKKMCRLEYFLVKLCFYQLFGLP